MSNRSSALITALLLSVMAIPALAQDAAPVALEDSAAAVDIPADPLNPAYDPDMTKAHAPRPGVQTLQDVLRWTYDSNPTIQAARAQLLATQESLPQAQSWWKPTADLSADATYVDSTSDGGDDYDNLEKNIGLDADQPLYRGGRTISEIDSAKNAIMAQRAFMIATEQDVLLQVATAYMNVLRDQSLYDLALNNNEVIARQLGATRTRFEVGDVTRTDVSQAQARLAQTEATRTRAQGDLRGSLAVLQQVSGLPPATLAFPDVKLNMPDSLDETVELAERYNPTVIATEFLHNAAQKDIDLVFGELLPSVGLFGAMDYTIDPSPGTVDDRTVSAFGLQASFPLYEAGSTRSRVRAAKNTAMQRQLEITEARRLARQQAVSNWEDLQAAKSEIVSRLAQVEASRLANEGVRQEAELGTRTILDALDAEQELFAAESALVTAQRDEVVARFALAATLGYLNPDVLGFPELYRDYDVHLREITGKIFSTDTAFGRDLAEKVRN